MTQRELSKRGRKSLLGDDIAQTSCCGANLDYTPSGWRCSNCGREIRS